MTSTGRDSQFLAETHLVENQPPALERYNLFDADAALREGVLREGAEWAVPDLMA